MEHALEENKALKDRSWIEQHPFWVHAIGPDELHPFDDELTALREANHINKQYVSDRLAEPGDWPFMVALVKTAQELKAEYEKYDSEKAVGEGAGESSI